MKYIAFTKVKLPYGWLGNMAPYPIVYENKRYKTSEALFQSLRFKDYPEIQEKIMNENSPMGAKMVAKSHKSLLEKDGYELLGQQDIEYMKICLKEKIKQHPDLVKKLLDTGDSILIEDCSSRSHGSGLFWGSALKNDIWVGQNVLGEMWMSERAELNQSLSQEKPPRKFPPLK
jgi:N-glycosidase YbiA